MGTGLPWCRMELLYSKRHRVPSPPPVLPGQGSPCEVRGREPKNHDSCSSSSYGRSKTEASIQDKDCSIDIISCRRGQI
jgi:hypothetical protein